MAPRYTAESLAAFVSGVLKNLDVPEEAASETASALVAADLRGVHTHGIPCLVAYAECLDQGRIKARPDIKVTRRMPWACVVDGDNGLGPVAATRAMGEALASARQLGIGAAAVQRSNHFGAAAAYALMALEEDCIGIITSNAGPNTAPFGTNESYLGTNPLAVSVPAGGHCPPFVIDMATSEAARKKIRLASEEGRPIPLGWALDQDGNPTTDASAAMQGVLLPFGGVKGSAIGLLTDILSGILSGARFGNDVLGTFTNQQREAGTGHFMMAFTVESFMPLAEFRQRMDTAHDRIKALKKASGVDEILLPGERESRLESEYRRDGIPLTPATITNMKALGARHDTPFPAPIT